MCECLYLYVSVVVAVVVVDVVYVKDQRFIYFYLFANILIFFFRVVALFFNDFLSFYFNVSSFFKTYPFGMAVIYRTISILHFFFLPFLQKKQKFFFVIIVSKRCESHEK